MTLINTEINQVITDDDIRLLEEFMKFDAMLKEKKKQADEVKERLAQYMEENGVDKINVGEVNITYVPGTTKRIVDTVKMKEEGIYDDYLKDTFSKGFVRITEHKEKKEEDHSLYEEAMSFLEDLK